MAPWESDELEILECMVILAWVIWIDRNSVREGQTTVGRGGDRTISTSVELPCRDPDSPH